MEAYEDAKPLGAAWRGIRIGGSQMSDSNKAVEPSVANQDTYYKTEIARLDGKVSVFLVGGSVVSGVSALFVAIGAFDYIEIGLTSQQQFHKPGRQVERLPKQARKPWKRKTKQRSLMRSILS
jgi:hypothetical protein